MTNMHRLFLLFLVFAHAHSCVVDILRRVKCHKVTIDNRYRNYQRYDQGLKSNDVTLKSNDVTDVALTGMKLHHQACFTTSTDESCNATDTRFYVVKYEQYTQDYKIRPETYQFGIPEIRSNCKCDCPGGDVFCTPKDALKSCNRDDICITSYHQDANPNGCTRETDNAARLCCSITVRPYKHRIYRRVRLKEPHDQFTVRVDVYEQSAGRWILKSTDRQGIHATTGSSEVDLQLGDVTATLQMSHRGTRGNLATKEYFYETSGDIFELKESPTPTNDPNNVPESFKFLQYDHRKPEGLRWTVPKLNGLARAHRPKVVSCKQQKYIDEYDAGILPEYYFLSGGDNPKTGDQSGRTVLDHYKTTLDKIQISPSDLSATPDYIKVFYKTSRAPEINVVITYNGRLQVQPYHHVSKFDNFTAKIQVDANNNHYLNITIINGIGKLPVVIHDLKGHKDVTLSAHYKEQSSQRETYSLQLGLPAHIRSERKVCVGRAQTSICQMVKFVKEPRKSFVLPEDSISRTGDCPGCNQDDGVKDAGALGQALAFLNPKSWFDGIDSVAEGVSMVIQLIVYFLIIVAVVAICRKCICPAAKWAFSSDRYRDEFESRATEQETAYRRWMRRVRPLTSREEEEECEKKKLATEMS